MSNLTSTLRNIARTVQSFQRMLSKTTAADRAKIEVPDGLVCAWLHVIIALVQFAQSPEAWDGNLDVASSLIKNGMRDIMENLFTGDLLQKAVVQPTDLTLILSWMLLKNSVKTSVTLSDTYSQYIRALVT